MPLFFRSAPLTFKGVPVIIRVRFLCAICAPFIFLCAISGKSRQKFPPAQMA